MAVTEQEVEALLAESEAAPGRTPITEAEVEALLAQEEPPFEEAAPEPVQEVPFEPAPAFDDAQLGAIFEAGLTKAPDKQAGVLEIARQTGIAADVVESRYDEFRRTYEAARFDPRVWREANPELAQVVLERPELGAVVMKDEKVGVLARTLREIAAGFELQSATREAVLSGDIQSSDDLESFQALKNVQLDAKLAPKPVPTVEAPEGGAEGLLRPLKLFTAEYRRNARALERSQLGYRILAKEAAGQDTLEDEKRALDLERDLVARDYGQGPWEQALLDLAGTLPSQVATLKGAGVVGVGTALVGGGLGALTRRPGAAVAGAKAGGKLGAMSGLVGTSFTLEAGGSYLEFRGMRTDDGRPVDPDVARGMALVYGMAAAGIEFFTPEPALAAMGPLGQAIKAGTGKAMMADLLRDATFRDILARTGKTWLKAGASEPAEEYLQALTQDAFGYIGRVVSAGEVQRADVLGSYVSAVDAAQRALPGGLAIGAPGAALNLTAHVIARSRAERAGAKVAAIAQVADSPTVKASPEAVARMVEQATAEDGEPVTHLYVDPGAFVRLFQSENADPAEAAAQLMGPDGARLLQEALATGGKLEVPVAQYLERWGGTDLAQRLAEDTTTRPGHLTPRELQTQAEALERRAQELAKQYEQEGEQAESAAEAGLVERMEEQLVATGRYDRKGARKAMAPWRAFIRTQAERFGLDPEKLFAELSVTVTRGDDEAPPTPSAPPAAPDTPPAPPAPVDPIAAAGEAEGALEAPEDADTSFDFGANVEPQDFTEARSAISRMREDNRAQAQAFLEYVTGERPERPRIDRALERKLNAMGVVDPVHGPELAFHEVAGAIDPQLRRGKVKGQEPEEFRRLRMMELEHKTGERYEQGPKEPLDEALEEHEERIRNETVEHVAVLRTDGSEVLRKTTGQTDRVPFTGAEIDLLRAEGNATLTHNHPSGSTLSSDDIATAIYANLREIRAVVPQGGVWRVLRPMEGWREPEKFPDFRQLREELAVAQHAGLTAARERMDKTVLAAGGDPADGMNAKGYTNELWRQFRDEELSRAYNEFSEQHSLGWRVEGLRPEARRDVGDRELRGGRLDARVRVRGATTDEHRDAGSAVLARVAAEFERALARRRSIIEALQETRRVLEAEAKAALEALDALDEELDEDESDGARARIGAAEQALAEAEAARDLSYGLTPGDIEIVQRFNQDDPKNLLVQHNLSPAGLLHADELGGLAAPSLAVSRVEHPLANFGAITLLGSPDLVDPKKGVPTFDADVYSPRWPMARFDVDGKAARKLRDELKPFAKRVDGYLDDLEGQLERDGIEDTIGSHSLSWTLRLAWLDSKGQALGVPAGVPENRAALRDFRDSIDDRVRDLGEAEFKAWATAKLEPTVKGRHIRSGSTASGRPRRIPYNLQNILKLMTKKIRQGEDFNYGLGTARSAGAKKFRSLEQIQKAREKIVERGQFESFKLAMTLRFEDLTAALTPFHSTGDYRTGRALASAIGEAYKPGRSLAAELAKDQFTNVPADLVREVADFAADLLAMPTEYFEAKPQRVVELQEFTAAVVPEGTSDRVLKVLKKRGLDVVTYQPDDEQSRQRAIELAARQHQILFQPSGKGPRGYTEFKAEGLKRVITIALNKNSDFSTFLHESGHVFLDLFGSLATHEEAPERLKQDWAETLKWLGVEPGGTIEREHHEKWARAFEAYLMEGKAPSARLAGAFERFKLWMMQVYRSISALNVELSEDIRGVFDRLLATDREIERTRQAMGLSPMFRSPDQAGMTPEQWQAYLDDQERATAHAARQADLTAMKGRLRESEAWWREGLAELQDEAAADYENLPARLVQRFLRGLGIQPDGSIEKLSDAVRLDRAAVEAMVGKEAGRRFLLRKQGGTHPDEVATVYGYATGKEMLEAVLALPPKDQWAKEQAEARMRERHREVLQDQERLREVVSKGLHGEFTARWLLKEWAVLRSKAGGGIPPVESIRRAAKLIVDRRSVRKLDAGGALASERAAADRAAKAAAKGDFGQAAVFKQQQLLNLYLHRELSEAREMREAFEDLAGDLSKDKARARLGKAGAVYRGGVDRILEAFGLKEVEQGRLEELPSLGAVLDAMVLDGATVMFDSGRLERLLAQPRPWQDLTVADLREVHTALQNIRGAARAKATALVDGKRMDRQQVVAELLAEAEQNLPHLGPSASSEDAKPWHRAFGDRIASFDADLLKPETMVRWLAGDDLRSTWFRAVVLPLQEAKAKEVDLLRTTIRPILDAFEKMPKEVQRRAHERVDGRALFPGHRKDIEPPTRRFELLAMALNMGNASNLERLLQGRGISMDEALRAINEHLSREDLEWVQNVWDAMESLWPEASALEERVTGLRPPKIEAVPLVTKHGTFRGGYYPAVYHPRRERVGKLQTTQAVAALMDPTFTRPGTAHGHLKSRVEGFYGALDLRLSVISAHLAQAAHDIAYREALQSVGGLVMDDAVQGALMDRLGEERAERFHQWLKDIGQMRGATSLAHAKGFASIAMQIRTNTVVGVLGWSARTALGDFANLFAALPGSKFQLKPKHWAAGLAEFALSPDEAARKAQEKSPELRTRRDQIQRELMTEIRKVTKRGPLSSGPLAWFRDHAFTFMEWSDRATSTPIWIAAYRQALAEGQSDADAVVAADALIRRLFPSHSPVDTAAIIRDKTVVGGMLMFYGYLNVAFNVRRDIAHEVHLAEGALDTVKASAKALGIAVSFSASAMVLSELFSGRGPEDEEEWEAWFLRKILAAQFQDVPGFSGAATAFEAWVLGKRTNQRASPLVEAMNGVGAALLALNDEDKGLDDKVLAVLRAAGPIVGVPAAAPARAAQYISDVADGDIPPPGPVDAAQGLIYGERPAR